MVSPGLGEEDRRTIPAPKFIAIGPHRSMPVHNFTLPCFKWGFQRHLPVRKPANDDGAHLNDIGDRRSPELTSDKSTANRKRKSEPERNHKTNARENRIEINKLRIAGDGDDGIEAMREKLMLDLRTAAIRMKNEILRKEAAEANENEGEKQRSQVAAAAPKVRPWNLRKRQAACKASVAGNDGNGLKIDEKKRNHSPLTTQQKFGSNTSDKTGRVEFSVGLSKEEIEEDFMEMLGRRPPRRPKKRPRSVQNELKFIFPGVGLAEITADLYKVHEAPNNGKRKASGLKSLRDNPPRDLIS